MLSSVPKALRVSRLSNPFWQCKNPSIYSTIVQDTGLPDLKTILRFCRSLHHTLQGSTVPLLLSCTDDPAISTYAAFLLCAFLVSSYATLNTLGHAHHFRFEARNTLTQNNRPSPNCLLPRCPPPIARLRRFSGPARQTSTNENPRRPHRCSRPVPAPRTPGSPSARSESACFSLFFGSFRASPSSSRRR